MVPPLGLWSWVLQENKLSKPLRSTPLWPLHHFLPAGPCPVWVLVLASLNGLWLQIWELIKSFLSPTCFWWWYFATATPTLTNTVVHEQAAPLYLAQLNLTPRTVSGGYIMSKATLEKKNFVGGLLAVSGGCFWPSWQGVWYKQTRHWSSGWELDMLICRQQGEREGDLWNLKAHIQWFISPHKAILSPKKPYLIVFPK